MTIREIIEREGFTQSGFAREFGIPVRTVQDWIAGKRTPPDYIVSMIDEIVCRRSGDLPKRFFVIHEKDGDSFGGDVPFFKKSEALAEADRQWLDLSSADKEKTTAFYVAFGDVDENGATCLGCNFDIVKNYK